MTEERLHELIAQGESLTVEFKGKESRLLSDGELVEAIVSSAYPDSEACTHKRAGADLVEARGERKGRTWHLSAATYRRLGQPAAYIRQRGFEPIQRHLWARPNIWTAECAIGNRTSAIKTQSAGFLSGRRG